MTRRWSFRTRFVAAAALCLLPLVGVVLFLLDQSFEHSRDQLIETEFTIADVVSQGLTATLDENQRALQDLSEDPMVQAMIATGAQEQLDQLRRARPSLSGVFLLSPDDTVGQDKGVVMFTGGLDPTPLLPQFSDAVDKVLNGGEPAITNRLIVPDSDVNVIAIVVPVLPDPGQTAEGQPVGVLGAFLNVARLQQTFLTASTNADTTIAVVADNGQVIVDRGNTEVTSNTLTTDLKIGPVQQAVTGQRGQETYVDTSGDERIAVFVPVGHPSVAWAAVVTSPSPTTYGPNRNMLEGGLIALAGAVVLTLALAVIFGELTARPLRQLTTRAAAITRGDMSQPLGQVGRGEVAALSNAFSDMADRLTTQVRDTEAAREEVAFQAERLRDLLRRTVRLQEDERRRIASDIHDAVSPLITGALYQARALKLSGNGHDANGANGHHDLSDEGLRTVNELLERAMSELHDVIFALRPPDLDDLGVVAAIERYVQQVNRSGLPCHMEMVGEAVRLSPEARLGLYRIVQEALHNALRHAHADEAVVRMEWLDDRLRVTIRDNGSGFDPDQAANPTSLGLLSMRERAAAIGGTLEIVSKPGTGTLVIVERPLANDLVSDPAATDAADAAPAIEPLTGDVLDADEAPVTLHEVRSA